MGWILYLWLKLTVFMGEQEPKKSQPTDPTNKETETHKDKNTLYTK